MNARVEWQDQIGQPLPASEEIRVALHRVMSSTGFARAPRMCALFSFLVEKKLGGVDGALTEHAIGMQLFRRDPACYDTAIDPVVRVQIGRLRSRLADYYGAVKEVGALEICIPAGSYMPVLRCVLPARSTKNYVRACSRGFPPCSRCAIAASLASIMARSTPMRGCGWKAAFASSGIMCGCRSGWSTIWTDKPPGLRSSIPMACWGSPCRRNWQMLLRQFGRLFSLAHEYRLNVLVPGLSRAGYLVTGIRAGYCLLAGRSGQSYGPDDSRSCRRWRNSRFRYR